MAKQVESIRLDPYHKEMVQMRTSELGIGTSQYFRYLVENDNKGRYRKPSANDYTQILETRYNVKISDSQVALLDAIKREYEKPKEANTKRPKDLKQFCEKYNFELKFVKADLGNLVKLHVLTHGKDEDTDYVWTLEGGIILPELAFKKPNDCPFVSGDMAALMKSMFGNYLESVKFIQDSFHMSWIKARKVFNLFLGEHVLFLNWLREHAFDMTGIAKPDDIIYYRKQMMNFLMSYCLIVRDRDFVDTDDELRKYCNDLVRRLANYLKQR